MRRGQCSSLGVESCEGEAERGQRARERIGTIFRTETFFSGPGITGNLQEEVGDVIQGIMYRRDVETCK